MKPINKKVYCWRCKRIVTALNTKEYLEIIELYRDCTKKVKMYRMDHGTTLEETPILELYAPVYDAHTRITGENGIYHDEIIKHHILDFGPPCPKCGKNLRTPNAKKCFECSTDGK